jgi:hypothetical protein
MEKEGKDISKIQTCVFLNLILVKIKITGYLYIQLKIF